MSDNKEYYTIRLRKKSWQLPILIIAVLGSIFLIGQLAEDMGRQAGIKQCLEEKASAEESNQIALPKE